MLFALQVAALITTAAPVSLASPGFNYIELSDKKGDFFADHFAQQLSLYGLRVTTRNEMSAVIGLERQKQLLGCSDSSSSCLAELAGALGADGIITGSLAKFRGGYTVNIKIIGATDAKPIAVASAKLKDDDALVEWLSETAKTLAPKLKAGLRSKQPPVEPDAKETPQPKTELTPVQAPPRSEQPDPGPAIVSSSSSGGMSPAVLVPAIAGGALLVGGGTMLFLAKGVRDDLESPTSSYRVAGDPAASVAKAKQAAEKGRLFATLGYVGVGVGAAAVVTAVVLGVTGGGASDGEPQASLLINGAGLGLAVGGSF